MRYSILKSNDNDNNNNDYVYVQFRPKLNRTKLSKISEIAKCHFKLILIHGGEHERGSKSVKNSNGLTFSIFTDIKNHVHLHL